MVGGALSRYQPRTWSFGSGSTGIVVARAALMAIVACALAVVVVASGLLLYGRMHQDRMYRGVTVAGVNVGGLPRDEAEIRIARRINEIAPEHLTLTHGDQRWSLPAEELGVRYDPSLTADQAMQFGRSGSLWTDSRQWLAGLLGGHTVAVAYQVDERPAFDALSSLAPEITRAPRNASFVFDGSGKLTVDPGSPGVGINVASTMETLRQRFEHLSSAPVTIETFSVPPPVQAKDLEPSLKQASAMVAQPLILVHRTAKWSVAPATLNAMLEIVPAANGQQTVTLSEEALRSYVAQLEAQVKDPGRNAGIEWSGTEFVVTPSTDGVTLDPQATARNIIAALSKNQHQVEVAVQSTPAAITETDAEKVAEQASKLVAQPITLTWAGGSKALEPGTLAPVIRFTEKPDQPTKLAYAIDADAIAGILEPLRADIEQPARDAEFRYLNRKVTVVRPEQNGTTLDIQRSTEALGAALTKGQTTVALATASVDPKITSAMASTIVIRERLASGETYYGGSLPNRKVNVELGVERSNGALVPPGGTFSFNDAVGPMNLAAGFKLGYGIVGTSNGSVSTVPSVGGGICQVATTLFHAVFWSGMPVVERNWHLYWIASYGQRPSGLKGLDATVDPDYGLDFRFKNTTNDWLAVVGTADGSTVRYELWGTDPGWDVAVDDPVISNVVKTNTEMKYEKTDQLPAGQSVFVEHAEDGFTASIHRRVTKGDQVIDDTVFRAQYRPSSNVTLVGTR